MPNLRIEEKIGFTVVSEEEVSDTASPTLADIRRKIRNSQAKVKEQLDRIIHSQTYQKFLQEPIVTMRDGRYCVPVKSEYRQEIKGMVHDTSGTGATIFIEPASVVEENNETRVLRAKEQQEIQRILHEISEDIGNHAQTFIEDYSALLVSVERKGRHLSPALNLVFQPADILWIVGNEASLTALHE